MTTSRILLLICYCIYLFIYLFFFWCKLSLKFFFFNCIWIFVQILVFSLHFGLIKHLVFNRHISLSLIDHGKECNLYVNFLIRYNTLFMKRDYLAFALTPPFTLCAVYSLNRILSLKNIIWNCLNVCSKNNSQILISN